ncbi:hypothetical protein GGF48_005502, partial [Coemansia sp. RSA 921]
MHFFTAGEKEVRAWTCRKGAKMNEAARSIHNDIADSLIQVDVMKFDELKAAGGEAELKAAGRLLTRSKDAIIEDGDIVYFRSGLGRAKKQHPTYRRLSTHFSRAQPSYEANEFPAAAERAASDFTGWERIGRGGFGKVYKAQPRNTQMYGGRSTVAIKVVDKRALRDSAAEQRLATEVAVHETLDHTHVVRLMESFEDDRYVYLVMEHCEHGDLWRYLRARRTGAAELSVLGESEARWVMRQIAQALAHLHSRGVLHRDLKLANIMLAQGDSYEPMSIRVGDFGLATRVDGVEPTTMCGTPSYISPEIIARQPYGLASDVWALG